MATEDIYSVFVRARDGVDKAHRAATNLAADLADGGSAEDVMNVHRVARNTSDRLVAARAFDGMGTFAQTMLGSAAPAFIQRATEIETACAAIADWIEDNFPKDSNGFLLALQFVSRQPQWRTFTAQQVAPLVTRLNALAAIAKLDEA